MKDKLKQYLSQVVSNSVPSSTVGIADIARKLHENGEDVINFSAGRAFEPTPRYIIDSAIEALNRGDTHQTLARGTTLYRNAISEKLRRENHIQANPEKEIIATNGVKQGLTISLLSILNHGEEVIVEDPCFVSYKQLIRYFGGKPVSVPLRQSNGFRWKKEDLEKAITSKTKAILFNSPHNPTGVVHTLADLNEIAEVARIHDLVVLADEVYERTTWGGRSHINIATLPGMKERTITLNSLTKSFSMGGWRIGYVYADERIINSMEKLQQHLITSCNSFVQKAAATVYANPPKDEVLNYWKEWEKKCEYFSSELNKIKGLTCEMPEGGFYAWVNISDLGLSSDRFMQELLEKEMVAVIPGASFGKVGEGFIRITCVKSWDEIHKGLDRIKKYVSGL